MTASSAASIRDAVDHPQAGRFGEAEAIYREILRDTPGHADALHLLGVLNLERGRLDDAVRMITDAVERKPDNPFYRTNLATAHLERGQVDQAVSHYQNALEIKPDHVDSNNNLGNAYSGTGDFESAAEHYRRTVEILPRHIPAQNNLAMCLAELGRGADAIDRFEAALRHEPLNEDTHNNMAITLQRMGRIEAAIEHYRRAVALRPDYAEAHNHLGTALEQIGDLDEAAQQYQEALRLLPDYADAHVNIGNLLRREERYEEAADTYRRALALEPNSVSAHNNLGIVLARAGRREEGKTQLRRALEIDPVHVNAVVSLAYIVKTEGDMAEATLLYDRAIDLAPDNAEARFGRGLVDLATGNFSAGWHGYLSRSGMRAVAKRFDREPLAGNLDGKHVLIERDQGLGDEIFFLRFVNRLRDRGARVSYLPDPRLARMVARAEITDRVLDPDEQRVEADLRLAVGDLPYLLRTGDDEPLPASIAIPALDERIEETRARLAGLGPPPYLGLTWRGGTRGQDHAVFKQAPLAGIAAALRTAAGTCLALQRRPEDGEIAAVAEALGREVHDLTALNDDLEGMLALLGLIDDYVCVSNTNVHLRAAQGRTSHVLVPNPAPFRWMAAGAESPWFPGTTVYRQATDGDWSAALAALGRDLAHG